MTTSQTTVTKSINKTIEYLKREHSMYSWDLFKSMVVKGLVQDGCVSVETPTIDGDWLSFFTKSGKHQEINLWNYFK